MISALPVAYQCFKTMPCDQVNVWPPIVVCGSGAGPVSKGLPAAVLAVMSARTSLASRIDPSTFSSPVPCSSMLKPASGSAVYIKIILIIFGVSFGFACSIRAAAPETIGVAIEVPLRYIRRLLLSSVISESNSGCCVTSMFSLPSPVPVSDSA